MSQTATKQHDFILGRLQADIMSSSKIVLPSNKDVLSHFIYLRRMQYKGPKVTKDSTVNEVLQKLLIIWQKACIPTIDISKNPKGRKMLLNLEEMHNNLIKHKKRASFENELSNFMKIMDSLFDISSQNAVELIQKDRMRTEPQKAYDISFLEDQRTKRETCLGLLDADYASKVQRKYIRLEKEKKRKEKHKSVKQVSATARTSETLLSSTTSSETDSYEEFPTEPTAGPSNASSPKNILASPLVSSTADRLNLSIGQRTVFAAAVAIRCGKDIEKLSLSRTTSARAARKTRKRKYETCIKDFTPPDHCLVHWDSKLLTKSCSEQEDRLAILVTGYPNVEKLLSVSIIDDSTGLSQATSVFQSIEKWNLKQNVFGVSFDTTASNSGWMKGSCKLLEELLQKKLIWLACRHHVAERVLCAVYETIFGPSKSPEFELFKEFRESKWKKINTKSTYNVLDVKSRYQRGLKEECVEFMTQCLRKSDCFPRDDYKEVAETTLMLLGEVSRENSHWRKPGAMHRARWMAMILYTNKMYAFAHQASYDESLIKKLKRMCLFNALIYGKYWLLCSNSLDSPANDLKFYHDLVNYKKEDREVANAALKSFANHYWYLTEEVVPLSFFGSLSNDEKDKIAKSLNKYPVPENYVCGQPVFPILKEDTKLHQLVGPISWHLFQCCGSKPDSWIKKPASTWEEVDDYNKLKNILSSIRVVNDTAERGIKLVQDFHDKCQNEEEFQGLLQIVEENRRLIPDPSKETLKRMKLSKE